MCKVINIQDRIWLAAVVYKIQELISQVPALLNLQGAPGTVTLDFLFAALNDNLSIGNGPAGNQLQP